MCCLTGIDTDIQLNLIFQSVSVCLMKSEKYHNVVSGCTQLLTFDDACSGPVHSRAAGSNVGTSWYSTRGFEGIYLTEAERRIYIYIYIYGPINKVTIGSDDLSPVRRQAIIYTNVNTGICQLDTYEETYLESESKLNRVHLRKWFSKCRLQNNGHFVSDSKC